jgi:hypothetical protein
MSRYPIDGIKGSKPQASPKQKPEGTLPKAEAAKLNREYLVQRNETLRLKNLNAQMILAQRRDQLIEKRLVEFQSQFLLVAMRQKILNLPTTYCRRLVGLKDVREVQKVLKGAAISILNEIKDLPSAVTDPHWLAKVEKGSDSDA